MYKRVLLKLSGEALSSPGNSFDPKILASLAKELKQVHELGVDLAIVVGGGNFIRGKMAEPWVSNVCRQTIWGCWQL